MADPFQSVIAGTPKTPTSARTMNGILRAGADNARRKFDEAGGPLANAPLVPACECQIQNLTGADLPQGSILVAGSAVVNPAVHPLAAQEGPTFTGVAVADVTLPFVVLSGPIPSNAIGDAVVSGLAVCTVIVSDAAHTRAIPVVGATTHLVSAASGGVPLWWTPGGTGTLVCLVMVGGMVSPGAYDSGAIVNTNLLSSAVETWVEIASLAFPSSGMFAISADVNAQLYFTTSNITSLASVGIALAYDSPADFKSNLSIFARAGGGSGTTGIVPPNSYFASVHGYTEAEAGHFLKLYARRYETGTPATWVAAEILGGTGSIGLHRI